MKSRWLVAVALTAGAAGFVAGRRTASIAAAEGPGAAAVPQPPGPPASSVAAAPPLPSWLAAPREEDDPEAPPRGNRMVAGPSGPVEVDLVRRLTAEFNRRNVVPPQRLAHFAWAGREGWTIPGWSGSLGDVRDHPDGSRRLTVRVRPHLKSDLGGVPFTRDQFVETYAYRHGAFLFLAGEPAADSSPGIFCID